MTRFVSVLLIITSVAITGCATSNPQFVGNGPVQEAIEKYLSRNNYKAYAIQVDLENRRNNDIYGFAYNMKNQQVADQRAIDFCLQQTLGEGERCVIYARGNSIVFMPVTPAPE